MKKFLPVLYTCPLFRDIEETDLLRMLTCLRARTEVFDKKYTILAAGYPAKYMGIVLSGTVQVIQVDLDGNKSILASFGPGQVFGEAFAIAMTPTMPVSVVAAEESEVMLIDAGHIIHTCETPCVFHQQLIFNLMRDLADKAIFFHQKLEIASRRSTREKLLTYLQFQASRTETQSFEIPFNRQELADFLDVDRSGLSVEIGKLAKEGILESNRNRFTLL